MTISQERVTPRRLKGFQDYSPEIMARRLEIITTLRHQARLAGFLEIGTPALEYSDVLLGVGGETDKQVFIFRDGGEREVGLRYDLTVPLARYVSENHGKIPLPFKRLHIGDVWRAEKPQKGRFREFCQGDVDIIGVDSMQADIEVIHTLYESLSRVMFVPFKLTCNHRQVLSALIYKWLGHLSAEQEASILITLDKLHKIGKEAIVDLLVNEFHTDRSGANTLVEILSSNDLQAIEDSLETEEHKTSWARFKKTVDLLKGLCITQISSIEIDLSVVRGLAYYTGIVFETTVPQMPNYGSICSGGRYNQLTERFTHHEMPGVGGSIGVDRLTALLEELEGQDTASLKPQVYITVAEEKAFDYAFHLAKMLRTNDISTDLPMKSQKLGAQFKQADRLKATFAITVGGTEMETRVVRVKNMSSGEEKEVAEKDLVERLS